MGSSAELARASGARRFRELAGETSTVVWAIALGVGAIYLVVFVVRLPHTILELHWNPDFVSGLTMPETLVRTGTSGHTVSGSSGQWVSLWFGLLTAKLPLHRQLWGVAPTLLFLATALIVGWSVAQVANRRAAILAVLLGVVASPLALAFFLASVAHNTLYPCTALGGAYLIWLTRGEGRKLPIALLVPVAFGIVVGACLASDLLVMVTTVIPLTVAALFAGVRRERRSRLIALSALVTAGVAILAGKLTTAIMTSAGFVTIETPAKAVPTSELPERARLLFKGLKALFNGYLGEPTATGTFHAELGLASTILMSAALLALLLYCVRVSASFLISGLRKRQSQAAVELARSLHVIYWVASGAAACGVFWIAAETGGGTDLHESYYGSVIFSVAAVVPLLLSSGAVARVLIPAAASIFFVASLVGLTSHTVNPYPRTADVAPAVARLAEANHTTVGYSGWMMSAMTWNTHGRATVRPVMECQNPEGSPICPFYQGVVPSWYIPQQRRSFLLVDSTESWLPRLPPGLGKPFASYQLGTINIYFYPYDIASRLGRPLD
jgi:hypothetical protein